MTEGFATMVVAQCREIAANFAALEALAPAIGQAGARLRATLAAGGKIMFVGNGGSAADSQHLAAEFTGRYVSDRRPLAAIALTVDSSALTAIGNDYGFDEVFSRQVIALGKPGDVLIAISTSGNSRNVVKAIDAARALGVTVIGLTGAGGGEMAERCDLCLRVPAGTSNRIQEMHIAIGHMLCGFAETDL